MRFPTLVRDGKERPIVAVTINVPGQHAVLFDALVDTGADVSLFPQSVADRLGLDLTQQPDVTVFAAIGGQCHYRLHEVEIDASLGCPIGGPAGTFSLARVVVGFFCLKDADQFTHNDCVGERAVFQINVGEEVFVEGFQEFRNFGLGPTGAFQQDDGAGYRAAGEIVQVDGGRLFAVAQ